MKKTLLLVVVLVCLSGISSKALAKVELSGTLFMESTWAWESKEITGSDDRISLFRLGAGESVIGVRYTSDDGRYEGFGEMALFGRTDDLTVEAKAAWFAYQARDFNLRFGLAPTISDRYWPNQLLDDGAGLNGFGKVFFDRNEQIRLSMGETYRLMVTVEAPYRSSVWEGGDSFSYVPALAASGELSFGNVQLNPWIRWENIRFEDGDLEDSYHSLDCGLGITGDFGLIGFTVAGAYGINTAQDDPVLSGDPLLIDNRVEEDVKQVSIWGEVRIGALSLGGGYAKATRDDWTEDPFRWSLFAGYTIELGQIAFQPEIAYFDQGEDDQGADLGSELLFGVSMTMEF